MTDRERKARAYYAALDGDDYERLAGLLAPSFTHYRPDRTIEGRERFVRFMCEERPVKDTSHPLDAVYAGGDDGVTVRGRLLSPDGDLIVSFVDVFSFVDAGIDSIHTYTR